MSDIELSQSQSLRSGRLRIFADANALTIAPPELVRATPLQASQTAPCRLRRRRNSIAVVRAALFALIPPTPANTPRNEDKHSDVAPAA